MFCKFETCTRQPRPGFANCDDHTLRLLKGAFGQPKPEPQSWHQRAREGVGRAYAVGGSAA